MTKALADMRRDYTRDGLTEAQAPAEPFALFHQWFADAVKTEPVLIDLVREYNKYLLRRFAGLIGI